MPHFPVMYQGGTVCRAKPSRFSGCGGMKPPDVVWGSERYRANGSAIDSSSRYSSEETTIEASVSALHGLPTEGWAELQIPVAVANGRFFQSLSHPTSSSCSA